MVDLHHQQKKCLKAGGYNMYRKKTVIVAMQMWDKFEVPTLEGVMKGERGDYLVVGAAGESYPIKRKIFEATYEMIPA
jgi:hypothetical protein